MSTFPVMQITQTIRCPCDKVYQFASNPENLPQWAAGLANSSLSKSGEEWITNSPMGQVKIKFVEKNPYGVIDHDVTLPYGDFGSPSAVQIWKSDPKLFAIDGGMNPIELYFALRTNSDERVQMSLDEMLKRYGLKRKE